MGNKTSQSRSNPVPGTSYHKDRSTVNIHKGSESSDSNKKQDSEKSGSKGSQTAKINK